MSISTEQMIDAAWRAAPVNPRTPKNHFAIGYRAAIADAVKELRERAEAFKIPYGEESFTAKCVHEIADRLERGEWSDDTLAGKDGASE